MKIHSKKYILPKTLLTITVFILLIGGYLAYANITNSWPFSSRENNTQQSTEPEVSDINDTEEAAGENPEANNRQEEASSGTNQSKQLTPGNTESADAKPLKPTISHATQSGDSIEVVATFNSIANGTCQLTLSKPGRQDIKRESPITIGPSYYICGFTVENASGTGWIATVTHANNNSLSEATTQRVD